MGKSKTDRYKDQYRKGSKPKGKGTSKPKKTREDREGEQNRTYEGP